MTTRRAQPITSLSFSLAVGQTATSARPSGGLMLVYIAAPAGATATAYTLQGSLDGSNWTNYLDETGAAISVTVSAGQIAALPTKGVIATPHIRLVANAAQLVAAVDVVIGAMAV